MTTATAPGTLGPDGAFVRMDGESFYRISGFDRMAPFLMNVASDTDLWMFLASSGGLTAGRVDPDGALFPYENVDRLYDAHYHTGPITLVRAVRVSGPVTWQPFSEHAAEAFRIERRLYKNVAGNRVIFEEINHDLDLAFRYRWSGCDAFGLVRTARLTRTGSASIEVAVLDGLRNVLPHGAPLALYQQQSSLIDAYKRSELDPAGGLAIFSLTAKIIDRAEAAEELRANVVWCTGLDPATITLDPRAPATFRAGATPDSVALVTGRRGHWFAHAALTLEPGAHAEWHVVADAGRGPTQVVALRERIRAGGIPAGEIERALDDATDALVRKVAAADGLQCTAHPVGPAHHFANVLFNIMRGGVFADGYRAPRADIQDFMRTRNGHVATRHATFLEALPDPVDVPALRESARRTQDADFERLCLEYLPLCFGRRHGDPSRPWNRFSIGSSHADGAPILHYEGNWRDIFQNWEALALSFPRHLPAMIARFVNASTVDGFNPYRIGRDGFEWEVVDPGDPWSYIGYWGDHQTIYLLRLLEALHRFDPGALRDLLDRRVFSYANVPYRLKPYADMRADPHATVDFDAALDTALRRRVREIGTDGRLVERQSGGVRYACLIEKLLVLALARLSNFVPGGGIWMNTQRPEWNDANNALAGLGVSTVTLCHLGRFLRFLEARIEERGAVPVEMAADVARWARDVRAVFERHAPAGGAAETDRERAAIVDALGASFEAYRERAYAGGGEAVQAVPAAELLALCRAARPHVERSIALNRRDDGLYHAYHVLAPGERGTLGLDPLYEMLEGQVAALGSGMLPPGEALSLVESLFTSPMYDPERRSFMLYPERPLPGFLEKNAMPAGRVRRIPLLRDLLDAGNQSLVMLDPAGTCRFHPDLTQARVLAARLDELAAREGWAGRVERDRRAVLGLYEEVFRHRSFTGRSGTMYGYEGIGCIYWHMVAKLLLAVQEQAERAARAGDPAAEPLIRAYRRIRAGFGFEKSPGAYGAFPTDPYSHTPRHGGASQPGMTGQVKEEILARFGEFGAGAEAGSAVFRPWMLARGEFLGAACRWRYVDLDGAFCEMDLPAGALAFTWCGVPVVYRIAADAPWVRTLGRNGESTTRRGHALDAETSALLFERRGDITCIEVGVAGGALSGG